MTDHYDTFPRHVIYTSQIQPVCAYLRSQGLNLEIPKMQRSEQVRIYVLDELTYTQRQVLSELKCSVTHLPQPAQPMQPPSPQPEHLPSRLPLNRRISA